MPSQHQCLAFAFLIKSTLISGDVIILVSKMISLAAMAKYVMSVVIRFVCSEHKITWKKLKDVRLIVNNDLLAAREVIRQWLSLSLVTGSLVKITGESPHSWPKIIFHRKRYIVSYRCDRTSEISYKSNDWISVNMVSMNWPRIFIFFILWVIHMHIFIHIWSCWLTTGEVAIPFAIIYASSNEVS